MSGTSTTLRRRSERQHGTNAHRRTTCLFQFLPASVAVPRMVLAGAAGLFDLETRLLLASQMVASREGGRRLRLRGQRNAPAGTVHPARAPCSPLVTIITAVFNGEDVLEETIQSVITQSSQDFEYLIMDGGSTDGTLDILRRYDDALDY